MLGSTNNNNVNFSNGFDAFANNVSAPSANNVDPFSVLGDNSAPKFPAPQTANNQSDLFDFFSTTNSAAFDNTKTSASAHSTPQVRLFQTYNIYSFHVVKTALPLKYTHKDTRKFFVVWLQYYIYFYNIFPKGEE